MLLKPRLPSGIFIVLCQIPSARLLLVSKRKIEIMLNGVFTV